MKRFCAVALLLLVGCAGNPYSRFYYDQTDGVDVTTSPDVVLSTEKPKLCQGNSIEDDCQAMTENAYAMVGYSHFNAGNVSAQQAIFQADAVHAEMVIVYSAYTSTVSGAIPLTFPNTKQSTTTTRGHVSGTGGYANYSGTSTTTTNASKTTYIPYNVNRYDYVATYWVKVKFTFGATVRPLTGEERGMIGSNKGVIVQTIINGSPAFSADILNGDILKRIGTTEIIDVSSYENALERYAGQEVDVLLSRDGAEIVKRLRLNASAGTGG